jgi:membrane fusion protein (multidrug efflux system)
VTVPRNYLTCCLMLHLSAPRPPVTFRSKEVSRLFNTLKFVLLSTLALMSVVLAQGIPGGAPPAVGVVKVEKRPVTETDEFIGRIQAMNRVDIVARVTAFLEEVPFKDGAEVRKGDVLYRLERGPFEADLDAKKAVADQMAAQLKNATAALDRAQALLKSQTGTPATADAALAAERSLAAQLLGANASVKQSQINLGYTEIAAPIDGKIGRTAITPGNVVSPSSGVLTTIIGQDPMYVVFPISVRTSLQLRERYAGKGGFGAVLIRLKLPDGRSYHQTGKLDFADNTIQTGTDTLTVRGIIPNPILTPGQGSDERPRELSDNEFVSVFLEGVEPIQVLAVPRSAVLSDQQGDYVFAIDADNKARRQDVRLGQSTPTVASIISGLKEGDSVVVEGLQRVRPGQPVSPGPPTASPIPSTSPAAR